MFEILALDQVGGVVEDVAEGLAGGVLGVVAGVVDGVLVEAGVLVESPLLAVVAAGVVAAVLDVEWEPERLSVL